MSAFGEMKDLLSEHIDDVAPPERHTILIIDDDPFIRESLKLLLADHYNVIECPSARDGLVALNADVRAVVLDVRMPGQDGFWACNEIHKLMPDIPVIFYSAYQETKDPFRIINEHYPYGYMAKGDDVQKLIDKIVAAVDMQVNAASKREHVRTTSKPPVGG